MAKRRLIFLRNVAEKARRGASLHSAVGEEGGTLNTFYRHLRAWDRDGVLGLVPRYSKCGRIHKSEEEHSWAVWAVAEEDLLLETLGLIFQNRRHAVLGKIPGDSDKKTSAVHSFFRCYGVEKQPLACGIAILIEHGGGLDLQTFLRLPEVPMALGLVLKADGGMSIYELMQRISNKIAAAKLF